MVHTGRVVCLVNNGNKVRMVWDDESSRDFDEKLLPTKYNKQADKSFFFNSVPKFFKV